MKNHKVAKKQNANMQVVFFYCPQPFIWAVPKIWPSLKDSTNEQVMEMLGQRAQIWLRTIKQQVLRRNKNSNVVQSAC